VPHLYNSQYTVQKLDQIVQGLLAHPGAVRTFAYFNNTAEGHALANAKQLQEICELVH
jgi:uncharacterized protein YecE (DUF72 family)